MSSLKLVKLKPYIPDESSMSGLERCLAHPELMSEKEYAVMEAIRDGRVEVDATNGKLYRIKKIGHKIEIGLTINSNGYRTFGFRYNSHNFVYSVHRIVIQYIEGPNRRK